jgi:hypothetical protein
MPIKLERPVRCCWINTRALGQRAKVLDLSLATGVPKGEKEVVRLEDFL